MNLTRLVTALLLFHMALILLTRLTLPNAPTMTLHTELIPPADQCRLPCWQGLRPGATGYAQALELVHRHPWVNLVQSNSYDGLAGWIQLDWSLDRPAWLLQSDGDGLRIDQNLVERISLHTTLTPADLWLAFGPPNWTRQYSSPPTQYLVHGWQRLGLSATMEIPCPASLDGFWRSPVNLTWVMFLPQTGNARPRPPVDLLHCQSPAS
jgi:hypothetical protein